MAKVKARAQLAVKSSRTMKRKKNGCVNSRTKCARPDSSITGKERKNEDGPLEQLISVVHEDGSSSCVDEGKSVREVLQQCVAKNRVRKSTVTTKLNDILSSTAVANALRDMNKCRRSGSAQLADPAPMINPAQRPSPHGTLQPRPVLYQPQPQFGYVYNNNNRENRPPQPSFVDAPRKTNTRDPSSYMKMINTVRSNSSNFYDQRPQGFRMTNEQGNKILSNFTGLTTEEIRRQRPGYKPVEVLVKLCEQSRESVGFRVREIDFNKL